MHSTDIKTQQIIHANYALRQHIGLDFDKQAVFAHDIASEAEMRFIQSEVLPTLLKENSWSGEMTVTFPHTNQSTINVYRQSRLITTDDGRSLVACAMLNITDQLQRQKELQHHKNELKRCQELQDQSPAMYFIADATLTN